MLKWILCVEWESVCLAQNIEGRRSWPFDYMESAPLRSDVCTMYINMKDNSRTLTSIFQVSFVLFETHAFMRVCKYNNHFLSPDDKKL